MLQDAVLQVSDWLVKLLYLSGRRICTCANSVTSFVNISGWTCLWNIITGKLTALLKDECGIVKLQLVTMVQVLYALVVLWNPAVLMRLSLHQ